MWNVKSKNKKMIRFWQCVKWHHFSVLAISLVSMVLVKPAEATVIVRSFFTMPALSLIWVDGRADQVFDNDVVTQGATINPLDVSVSALVTNGNESWNSIGTGSATWMNAADGLVIFDDIGWITSNVTSSAAGSLNTGIWSYTFIADTDGLFTLDWNAMIDTATTNSQGLVGFTFGWTGAGGGRRIYLNGSHSLTRAIVSGTQYTVGISSFANLGAAAGGVGNRITLMDGVFDWRMDMASVPIPAAAWLFGSAFLGLGLVKRKRA
jgi:hypothetical protein